jgi:hypothetical protein
VMLYLVTACATGRTTCMRQPLPTPTVHACTANATGRSLLGVVHPEPLAGILSNASEGGQQNSADISHQPNRLPAANASMHKDAFKMKRIACYPVLPTCKFGEHDDRRPVAVLVWFQQQCRSTTTGPPPAAAAACAAPCRAARCTQSASKYFDTAFCLLLQAVGSTF